MLSPINHRLPQMRNTLVIILMGLPIAKVTRGSDPVDVKLTPAMREYCHVLRFPRGWKLKDARDLSEPLSFSYSYDAAYEFRIAGLLGTRFLISGAVDLGRRFYTINKYEVDLSDPKAIPRVATEKEWQAGTTVPVTRNGPAELVNMHLAKDRPFPFHGFLLPKTGNIWPGEYSRISPDRAWIVLLSSSGKTARSEDVPLGHISGRFVGKLFFDVFNADIGKKVLTIVATYMDSDPGHAMNQVAWVTERYFVLPLGEHRERCLVCEFGRGGSATGRRP
jgi:hypothetical protein